MRERGDALRKGAKSFLTIQIRVNGLNEILADLYC